MFYFVIYYVPFSVISRVFLLPGGSLVSGSSPYKYLFYAFLVIVIVYLLMKFQTGKLFRALKQLKEKEEAFSHLEMQKLELEIREKNITESLIYAQRIQEAMLPSEEYLRSHFEDSFILFRPKSIVSGDFYWIEKKNKKIFVVGADCTGHGVPGALMSMIGLEILDKTINVDNIEKPSAVLDILSKELEKTFRSEKNIGTIIRDGMDIGMCLIDKENRRIEYAGAFFPLYLLRDNSLIEIKGDKLNIGMNPAGISYTNHEISVNEDDILYIFSDGYVDQFGGNENKKFTYRRFRYLLTTIHRFPLSDQKAILEDNIRTWMGANLQIDDIMVLGFKPLSGPVK